ncbi:MAG: xanthine dehydrogenase family protein molybdopterin-binding subunit [Chloroflexi bacterium]|nr:xanthine dehydrogenase family protein molybdopterin-binding subunit [Chloroflexota bacterium]
MIRLDQPNLANLPELRHIGKPLPRIDAMGKVTGATKYAGDYVMPNMLHAKVLRSKYPSAKILRIDVSKARGFPGIVAVLTADDLPGARVTTDIPGVTDTAKRAGTDAPILAKDRVRFMGEAIAIVAAEELAIAERASDLIEVDYEPYPAVFTPAEAMQPGAPIVTEPDNIVARWRIVKGDADAAMKNADVIVEGTYKTQFIDHAYLEPEAGIAWVDENGVLTIRVSTQVVEHFRSIAAALQLPQNKVHVMGALVGGGFGGKEDITVELFIGLAALKTRRPVKMIYTREESLLAHCKRHPFTITHKTGVTRSGRIVAAQVNMLADSGAYVYLSPYVLLYAASSAVGPYRVNNVTVNACAVATNNTFTSAFRGFGAAQACVAYEQQMDEIARELDMDPRQVRRINYAQAGDTTPNGQAFRGAVWLEECAQRAWDALGEETKANAPHMKIGRGLASYMQSYGRITWFHDTSQAWVGLEMDGSIVIRCGVPDIGGGQMNTLAQITAEVLGVPMERITVYGTDSALTPLAGTTTATRQMYMSGNATYQAALAVRKTLAERASQHLECELDEIDFADNTVFVKNDASQNMPLTQLIAICAAEGLPRANLSLFKAPFTDKLDPDNAQGDIWPDYTFGAQAVKVAVDTETGEVRVLKSAACHDVGRALNPAAVAGQIEGGAAQGLGYALMEDVQIVNGVTLTPSFAEYLIPTASDIPETKTIILESGTGLGPFGAKGIGEPALTPMAPAIANAVADAIGARVTQLPLTPERVLEAIDKIETRFS